MLPRCILSLVFFSCYCNGIIILRYYHIGFILLLYGYSIILQYCITTFLYSNIYISSYYSFTTLLYYLWFVVSFLSGNNILILLSLYIILVVIQYVISVSCYPIVLWLHQYTFI